ncbi:MAG: acetyl-CoA carboxylase biotin carboxyl carrier protein subunit [Cellvibrionaceae bacterium]|nr:acetyl-CoA carboxylase biotin carboxyl carrier protein subunit [Cellvibrionaceae bacterium]
MKKYTNVQTRFVTGCLLAVSLFYSSISLASDDHEHNEGPYSEDHKLDDRQAQGPHGGKLLRSDDLSIEVTVYENGVDPEMRLYAYHGNQTIHSDELTLEVQLARLGGEKNQLSFTREQDYWVGDQTIAEPHSYDVTVKARLADHQQQWQYASHEGRTQISERQQKLASIDTELAQAKTLNTHNRLFGVVSTPEDQIYHITAPYSGTVTKIHVQTGGLVSQGQPLFTIRNRSTLQSYTINSPVTGEVSERLVGFGEAADAQPLMIIRDLSKVWVEMSAFPQDIEQLRIGQPVTVSDMHGHESANGRIEYISPQMTEGHIARARVTINNREGHWRPGMHVKANILINSEDVALAVEKKAIQSFREMDVVFAKFGDTFEVRMVELGRADDRYVEVLSGLKVDTEYVTENSFLLKADVLKDGASHDH